MSAVATDPRTELGAVLGSGRRLFVLTGAGVSTESGIPDYRDEHGRWKRTPPIRWQEYVASDATRRRYWARSFVGWPATRRAQPNPAHHALAALERGGRLELLVTQNVDGLHQKAGSCEVLDLHGRLDVVACTSCGAQSGRDAFQEELAAANPGWGDRCATLRPDGDADLGDADTSAFAVPPCGACGGVLKPGFVFFGDSVPRQWVDRAMCGLDRADAALVAGSSLMVWSGYRFARAAAERGLPLAIVGLGRTRADDLATVRVSGRCGEVLSALVDELLGPGAEERRPS